MKPKLIALIILVLLFLIFLMQNTEVVTLRLYFWKISMSQIILIPLVLIIGFVCGFVADNIIKKKKKNRLIKSPRP